MPAVTSSEPPTCKLSMYTLTSAFDPHTHTHTHTTANSTNHYRPSTKPIERWGFVSNSDRVIEPKKMGKYGKS